MRAIVPFLAIALSVATMGMAGCPTPTPTPPSIDAGLDAAPVPTPVDVGPVPVPTADSAPAPVPVPPVDPCTQACSTMTALGCTQAADCPKVLGLVNSNRTNRNPKTGNALTCTDLVGVKSAADVAANGWACIVPAKPKH